jgi:STE24 endopeptidase
VLRLAALVLGILAICHPAWNKAPAAPSVPVGARASADFNAEKATEAWLASVPAAARARSNAYFEGSYWLLLWNFLFTCCLMLVLLETRLSSRLRDRIAGTTSSRAVQSLLYWFGFLLITSVLAFPLTVYQGFIREHRYGLSNQDFGGWLREELLGLALALLLGGAVFMAFAAIVQRLPATWHLWGTAAGVFFLIVDVAISPVFIAPLFNTYRPLQDAALKNQILSLARASGISAGDVYEVDASRQSKRVSANVSGFLGTQRISLNDNLIERCSPAGVLSTMGHEMGHYVMHHIYKDLLFFALLIAAMFGGLRWAMEKALARWGPRWRLGGVSDLAALPLAVLILTVFGFVFTPVVNSWIRMQEYEADLYGLNAARQPDGEAEVDLLLGEYRKLDPGRLEEMLFFDHPSGRTRVFAAMRWKGENLCLFNATLPCASRPQALTPGR